MSSASAALTGPAARRGRELLVRLPFCSPRSGRVTCEVTVKDAAVRPFNPTNPTSHDAHPRLSLPPRPRPLPRPPPRNRSASPARRTSRPTASWSPSATSATSGSSRPSAASPGRSRCTRPTTSTRSSAPTASRSPSAPTATAATTSSSSPSHGGKPTPAHLRLAPPTWSPAGRPTASTSSSPRRAATAFPPSYELYTVPVDGRPARKLPLFEGEGRRTSRPTGDRIAYVRGPGTWYRKGYRGSSNDDIWVCNADGSNNRRLTTFDGQDGSPMWAPDGQSLYYVSEHRRHAGREHRPRRTSRPSGKSPDAAAASPSTRTTPSAGPASAATASGSSTSAAPTCGSSPPRTAAQPRKLAIEVNADDKTNTEQIVTFTSDATEFALSPDEKHVAFAVHGELFLMPLPGGGKATRLTDRPAYDHGVAWSPGRQEDPLRLRPRRPRGPLPARAGRPRTPEAHQGPPVQGEAADQHAGGRDRRRASRPNGKRDRLPPRRQAVDDEPRRHATRRCWSSSTSGLRLRLVAGRQVDRLRPHRRLVRQRAVHRPGRRQRPTPKNVTRYATYNGDVTWSQHRRQDRLHRPAPRRCTRRTC